MSRFWDYHGGLIGFDGRPTNGVHNLHSIYNHGVLVGSGGAPTYTYVGSAGDASNISAYSFASQSIGTATSAGKKRYIIVGVGGMIELASSEFTTTNVPFSSCTLDSNAMTEQAGCTETPNATASNWESGVAIFMREESDAATTATIAPTADVNSGGLTGCGIHVAQIQVPSSQSLSVVSGSVQRDSDDYTLSVTIPSYQENDIILAVGFFQNETSTASRFGGTLGITHDGNVDTNTDERLFFGSKLATGSGTNETITFIHSTETASSISGSLVACVLRAA